MPIRFNIYWLMIAVAIAANLSAITAHGLLSLTLLWVMATIWISIPGYVAKHLLRSRQASGQPLSPDEKLAYAIGLVLMAIIFGICLIAFLALNQIAFL